MRFEIFIARRLGTGAGSASKVVKVGVAGVAISVAVMLLTVAVVKGFQQGIKDKVYGVGAHLQVAHYQSSSSLDVKPMPMAGGWLDTLRAHPLVKSVRPFAFKAGVVLAKGELHGVVAKGMGQDFDRDFFKQNLSRGVVPQFDVEKSDSILVPKPVADALRLQCGEKVTLVFVQNEKERKRRFVVAGIYETGMPQFDANLVLCHLAHVQKLNDWDSLSVAGFELSLNDHADMDQLDALAAEVVPWQFESVKITDRFIEIFGWLQLQDYNVVIILVLMTAVCAINVISTMLVMVLERTSLIGTLKTLGAGHRSVAKVFFANAAALLFRGLLIGNAIALTLLWTQHQFKWMQLDKSSYYLDHVPVSLNIWLVLAVNALCAGVCLLALLLPSLLVARMQPIAALKIA